MNLSCLQSLVGEDENLGMRPGFCAIFATIRIFASASDSQSRDFPQRGFSQLHLHAFCLLPNHFHFVLSGGDISLLTAFLGAIQGSYAKYFNIRHERRGQVFEGRYNAKLLADEEYLANCMSYVCYNALKHELVTDIREWPWTSYHELIEDVIEPHLPRVVLLDGVTIGEYVDIDEE